ncbi:MAG: YdcF family protein [Desulfobacteraceae bacterium]|nr:MAG: YdcF family protein [Desulfobacteraceae bacterium]
MQTRILKKLCRFSAACGALALVLIVLQAAYFHYIFYKPANVHEADAVVVFAGSPARIQEGFRVVEDGLAARMIISPASDERLKDYGRKYAGGNRPIFHKENLARTTFENALFSARIIDSAKLSSVILVTSDFHMPRSWFLLKMMLLGDGVRVERFAVAAPTGRASRGARQWRNEKMIYNEMVQFWGSLYELAYHRVTGELAATKLNDSKMVRQMKAALLFD